MCWWRVLMESDSRWPSDSCQYSAFQNAYTLRCQDTDVFSTRWWRQKGSDKLSWELTLIWVWALIQQIRVSFTSKQTGIAQHAQQQLWPISNIRGVAQIRRKTTKTPRRVSKQEGTTSSTWANRQTWLHFSICACHPNILPQLPQDCHTTQWVTVVGVEWLF